MSTDERFGLWLDMPNQPMTLEAFVEAVAWTIHPGTSDETEEDRAFYLFGMIEGGMQRLVDEGKIVPRNRITRIRETVLTGMQFWRAVVFPGDVRQFLADQGIGLRVIAEAIPQTVESRDTGADWSLLASRDQLIAAFGSFTGMDRSWFDNLTDSRKLREARKHDGTGGRNSVEPMFCPYEVMVWLMDPKRKKGLHPERNAGRRPLSPETGWRLLQGHFPKVYDLRSTGDPRQ